MSETRTFTGTGLRDWLRRAALVLAVVVLAILVLACVEPEATNEAHDETSHAAVDPETEHDAAAHSVSEPDAEHSAAEMGGGDVMIDSRKQQLVGVTYGVVERRDVEEKIRAVGVVAYDEKRLTDVTLKFGGWIEDLYVDETGMLVQKGQELFSFYSPDLVSTQEDYLTAYDHFHRIKGSEHREAVEAAGRLLDSARQRLESWDIEDIHWKDLERDRKVLRSLPINSHAPGSVI